MLIKPSALAQHLKKSLLSLYVIHGSDLYLLEESVQLIKEICADDTLWEEKKLQIQTAEDWQQLINEANSYTLFSENTFLNVRCHQKNIDAKAKALLMRYLSYKNPRCLILLKTPEASASSLQWVATHTDAALISATPLSASALQQWIMQQLKKQGLQFTAQLPELIQTYTAGNMQACAQVLEKISLIAEPNTLLTEEEVLLHLTPQSDYNLYELTLACLLGDKLQALRILKQSEQTQAEPVLILWLLTNEIRLLLQLNHLTPKKSFKDAANQLKIWPSRMALYQKMQARLSLNLLSSLLDFCFQMDKKIKTGLGPPIWHGLEYIALSLCLGQGVGMVCKV